MWAREGETYGQRRRIKREREREKDATHSVTSKMMEKHTNYNLFVFAYVGGW